MFPTLLTLGLAAHLFSGGAPSAAPKDSHAPAAKEILQYEVSGTRWLDSRHRELVHFICRPGPPYTISLDGASLARAGVPSKRWHLFVGALAEAVDDWAALMSCPHFRVAVDHPLPQTRVVFGRIDAPSTLATATRAGDITLNAQRRWFPGGRQLGHYKGAYEEVSFYWVIAHELGHVWGLAHSDDPNTLMYPSQCPTCRWSSFEQAAGNVIRTASAAPRWSHPHYMNRHFARTPIPVVTGLLSGALPQSEPPAGAALHCGSNICLNAPATTPTNPSRSTLVPDPSEVALVGWPEPPPRPRDLRAAQAPSWRPTDNDGRPRQPTQPPGRGFPGAGEHARLLLFPAPRGWWTETGNPQTWSFSSASPWA